jgi:hypothetical protein
MPHPHPAKISSCHQRLSLCLLLSLWGMPDMASAVELKWGGKFQSDVRFRLQREQVGEFYNRLELPAGVAWNQNFLKIKLEAVAGSFAGVADVDLVWIGYSAPFQGISDLTSRERVDPYRLKAHSLYVEATDLGLTGLDLRVGQQQVLWGKGDQFNPTNNLNANDLEDVLLFGERLSNLMARVDYNFLEAWTVSGVLVPIFKPAVLPNSAPLGIAAADRIPYVSDELRWRLHTEKALTGGMIGGLKYPTTVSQAVPVLPDTSLKNMQYSFRLAGVLAEQDIALSYYNGRIDLPQPFLNYTSMKAQASCDPLNPTDCINGLLETETYLGYPRIQVAGFNMAGEVNALGWLSSRIKPLGYRVEVGVYIPQEASLTLLQGDLDFGVFKQPAGEYAYTANFKPGDRRPLVVDSTPFVKWAVGLDYSFSEHVYANAQWVHGLSDDFGAGDFFHEGWSVRQGGVEGGASEVLTCYLAKSGQKCAKEILRPRLGDYLVLGADFKFLSDKALLRLFTLWDLNGVYEEHWDAAQGQRVRTHHGLFSSEGFSAIIYPEFDYNLGNGFELGAGALLALGKEYSKFGDPATGGSFFWTRARFSY